MHVIAQMLTADLPSTGPLLHGKAVLQHLFLFRADLIIQLLYKTCCWFFLFLFLFSICFWENPASSPAQQW